MRKDSQAFHPGLWRCASWPGGRSNNKIPTTENFSLEISFLEMQHTDKDRTSKAPQLTLFLRGKESICGKWVHDLVSHRERPTVDL